MKNWIVYILVFCGSYCSAQDSSLSDSKEIQSFRKQGIEEKNHKRKWLIGAGAIAGYGTTLVLFNEAWYKNYPRSSFHTFNDAGEWLQMDKVGHAWGGYNTSRITYGMWKWAGLENRPAVLLGTGSTLLFLLSVEYLDGKSAAWGWSWADAGADLAGATLFAAQQLAWKEQKFGLKFSTHYRKYHASDLSARADQLFGKTLPERLLKDYNAQTHWLSGNLRALTGNKRIPAWLNISIGYGAEGMFGGFQNIAMDKNGTISFDRRDVKRYRQWFLSPDIDLTRIPTKSKFLKSVFSTLNILKFPAPALEFSNNRFRLKALMF